MHIRRHAARARSLFARVLARSDTFSGSETRRHETQIARYVSASILSLVLIMQDRKSSLAPPAAASVPSRVGINKTAFHFYRLFIFRYLSLYFSFRRSRTEVNNQQREFPF